MVDTGRACKNVFGYASNNRTASNDYIKPVRKFTFILVAKLKVTVEYEMIKYLEETIVSLNIKMLLKEILLKGSHLPIVWLIMLKFM